MQIVFLLFPRITALDFVGPYEVLSRVPGAQVTLVAPDDKPVSTGDGILTFTARRSIAEVSSADVLVVPGGFGTRALERDSRVIEWVRAIHETTTWTTSVCTGALVLGAAGLLSGKKATTHWALLERLREYDAEPVRERIVKDGKVMTAAGVSAGIDMGLELVAHLSGERAAQAIQLGIEYDPKPPFNAGNVDSAPPDIVELVRARIAQRERSG